MEPDPTPPLNLAASLRRVCEAVLGTLENRIELFAVELQEEKLWLVSTLIWCAAAVFFGGLAILLVIGTIIYIAPEGARPWILGVFALAFCFVTINAVVGLRRSLRNKPPVFSDTIGELRKDIDWIRSRD